MSKATLSAVAADLIAMPMKRTDSFNSLRKRFFAVMRKHGVKQGTETENGGRLSNNPDWQGAEDMFAARVQAFLQWEVVCGDVPKDLLS